MIAIQWKAGTRAHRELGPGDACRRIAGAAWLDASDGRRWIRSLVMLTTLTCLISLSSRVIARGSSPASPPSSTRQPLTATLLRDDAALTAWIAQRHPDVMASQARVRQAEAGVQVARLRPNPLLNLALGGMALGRRNPPGLPWQDSLNISAGVSQTIEIGKREPRARAAILRRDASHQSHRDVLAGVVAEARDRLAQVVFLGTRRAILEQRLASARSIALLQKARLDHGDISGTDYDRLVLDAVSVEREVADATAAYQAALGECAVALAAPCSAAFADLGSLDAAAQIPQPLPELARSVRTRPDLQALQYQRAAAQTEAKLWQRQAIPDPTLGVSYTRDYLTFAGNQPNTLTLSLALPLPVFDRGRPQSRLALAQGEEFEWQARALEQRALEDARALLSRLHVLQHKLERLEQVALPRSDAVLTSTEAAFQRGGASMTDLLLARRDHLGIRLEQADTHYELFALRNALRQVLGLDAARASLPAGVPGDGVRGDHGE